LKSVDHFLLIFPFFSLFRKKPVSSAPSEPPVFSRSSLPQGPSERTTPELRRLRQLLSTALRRRGSCASLCKSHSWTFSTRFPLTRYGDGICTSSPSSPLLLYEFRQDGGDFYLTCYLECAGEPADVSSCLPFFSVNDV